MSSSSEIDLKWGMEELISILEAEEREDRCFAKDYFVSEPKTRKNKKVSRNQGSRNQGSRNQGSKISLKELKKEKKKYLPREIIEKEKRISKIRKHRFSKLLAEAEEGLNDKEDQREYSQFILYHLECYSDRWDMYYEPLF